MSKTHPFRTRPDPADATPGATTTLVRADARPHAEQYPELHPQLKAQLRELQLRTGSAVPDVPMLLRLINEQYETVERERRGIVESMRLMADEAQALAHEAREQSSEHLQVILDHIKDVVLLLDEEGVIRTFNPTGERVFGYAQEEVIGQRIDLLLPKIASDETIPQALQRLAASLGDTALDLSARELWAQRKNGGLFPAEIRRQQGAAVGARDVRAVPARCHRAARVRAVDARERRALPAAGRPRPRCHRRARRRLAGASWTPTTMRRSSSASTASSC